MKTPLTKEARSKSGLSDNIEISSPDRKKLQQSDAKDEEADVVNGEDEDDEIADLIDGEASPAVRGRIRQSQHQSSMKSISENDDEYTKMLIRQQMDEKFKQFEEQIQQMMEH